jgi:hypothetical protein
MVNCTNGTMQTSDTTARNTAKSTERPKPAVHGKHGLRFKSQTNSPEKCECTCGHESGFIQGLDLVLRGQTRQRHRFHHHEFIRVVSTRRVHASVSTRPNQGKIVDSAVVHRGSWGEKGREPLPTANATKGTNGSAANRQSRVCATRRVCHEHFAAYYRRP